MKPPLAGEWMGCKKMLRHTGFLLEFQPVLLRTCRNRRRYDWADCNYWPHASSLSRLLWWHLCWFTESLTGSNNSLDSLTYCAALMSLLPDEDMQPLKLLIEKWHIRKSRVCETGQMVCLHWTEIIHGGLYVTACYGQTETWAQRYEFPSSNSNILTFSQIPCANVVITFPTMTWSIFLWRLNRIFSDPEKNQWNHESKIMLTECIIVRVIVPPFPQ